MVRKILFLFSLVLLAVSPVKAQDDVKAAGAAIDTIIRVFSEYEIVDRFVTDIYSKYEKDKTKGSILAARIAKAYYNYVMVPGNPTPQYHRRDVPKALEYLDKAIALDPKYPQTYLVASDIYYNEAKIDTALVWLDKGIAANPTDSSLYIESAKLLAFSDPDAAVEKLMVLKQRDSTFQVDLQLGRLYYKLYSDHGKLPMKELAESYGNVYDSSDRGQMNLGDLGAYSLGLQWAGDLGEERFAKLYEATAYGLERFPKDFGLHHFPKDFGLHHFHLLGCMNTQTWDAGIKTMDAMLVMPDSVKKMTGDDYLWYASCLGGAKRYDDAISVYERVINMDIATATNKTQAESAIVRTINTQVTELRQMGDYEKAVAIVEPALQRSREKGNQNDQLVSSYAKIYTDWSVELNGTEKLDAITKAVQIYEEGAKYSELNKGLFLYFCCSYSGAYLDPKFEKGAGLPYAEQLIALFGNKADLNNSDKAYLVQAYRYMMMYEYLNKFAVQKIKKSKAVALAYADKILDVDPTNADALNFISKVN